MNNPPTSPSGSAKIQKTPDQTQQQQQQQQQYRTPPPQQQYVAQQQQQQKSPPYTQQMQQQYQRQQQQQQQAAYQQQPPSYGGINGAPPQKQYPQQQQQQQYYQAHHQQQNHFTSNNSPASPLMNIGVDMQRGGGGQAVMNNNYMYYSNTNNMSSNVQNINNNSVTNTNNMSSNVQNNNSNSVTNSNNYPAIQMMMMMNSTRSQICPPPPSASSTRSQICPPPSASSATNLPSSSQKQQQMVASSLPPAPPLTPEQMAFQAAQQQQIAKQIAAAVIPPSESTRTKVQIATDYTNRYYTHYLITNNGQLPSERQSGDDNGDDEDEDEGGLRGAKQQQHAAGSSFISDHTRQRQRKLSAERDFHIIETVGCGAFGEVFLCTLKTDPMNTLLVMKKLRKTVTMCRKQVLNVRTERDILVSARNASAGGGSGVGGSGGQQRGGVAPRSSSQQQQQLTPLPPLPLPSLDLKDWAVDIYYSFQDEEFLYFILEYCAGGDLMTWLMDLDVFPERVARFYLAEIALAVEALHRKGYAHRDIKPDNLLIDSNGHIKLTDFGLAKHVGGGRGENGLGGAADGAVGSDSGGDDDDGAMTEDDALSETVRSTNSAAANAAQPSSRRLLTREEKLEAKRAEKEAKQEHAWLAAMGDGHGSAHTPQQQHNGGGAAATTVAAASFPTTASSPLSLQQQQPPKSIAARRARGQFLTAVGSPGYMAPEVVIAKPSVRQQLRIDSATHPITPYSTAADWWSVGIILYEMLYGYVPFHTDEESSVQFKIIHWRKYLEFPGYDKHAKEPPPPRLPSPAAIDLMRRLICAEEDRIGFDEILTHPFFEGIKWAAIREERPKPIFGPSPTNPGERIVTGFEAPPFVLKLQSPTDTRYFDLSGVKHQQKEQQRLHLQYKEAYDAKLGALKAAQQVRSQKLQQAVAAAQASHSMAQSIKAAHQSVGAGNKNSNNSSAASPSKNKNMSDQQAEQLNNMASMHEQLQRQQQAALQDLAQHSKALATDDIYTPSDKRYLFYGFTAKFGVGGSEEQQRQKNAFGGGGANNGGPALTKAQQRNEDMKEVMTGGVGTKSSKLAARPALEEEFDED